MVAKFLRLPDVAALTGLRTTSIYAGVKAGTLSPPVKLTPRASAWPEHEIAAINNARLAGRSDNEIRSLVAELVKARRSADQLPHDSASE